MKYTLINRRAVATFIIALLAFAYFIFGYYESAPQQDPPILPSPTPVSASESASLVRVSRVIDGDTIVLETGERVRYIGIDTPETVDPRRPAGCMGKEAAEKNREFVDQKEVRLEKDISETDSFGRLLRYVWIGDTMVNELLVRQGFAAVSTFPPDIAYQDRFVRAQQEAQEEGIGLWSDMCQPYTEE